MKSIISFILLQCAALAACYGDSIIEDLAAQHNAIILGNLLVDSADTEGRQLVTGNFTTDIDWLYTVGQSGAGHPQNPASAGRDDLIVGGNYSHTGGIWGGVKVTEDMVVGGNADSSNVSFSSAETGISSGQGTLTENAGALKIDRDSGNVTALSTGVALSDLGSMFTQESLALSQQADSSGISITTDDPQALEISASDFGIDDTYVINISQSQWEDSYTKTRKVIASAGSTVILNIEGSDISLTGGTMSLEGGITNDKVLINYFEATSISLGLEHTGSVLAPNTQTVTMSQSINGVGIFGGEVTKTNSAEFHNFLFTGDIAHLVPEPSSLSLFAMGGLALFIRRRP